MAAAILVCVALALPGALGLPGRVLDTALSESTRVTSLHSAAAALSPRRGGVEQLNERFQSASGTLIRMITMPTTDLEADVSGILFAPELQDFLDATGEAPRGNYSASWLRHDLPIALFPGMRETVVLQAGQRQTPVIGVVLSDSTAHQRTECAWPTDAHSDPRPSPFQGGTNQFEPCVHADDVSAHVRQQLRVVSAACMADDWWANESVHDQWQADGLCCSTEWEMMAASKRAFAASDDECTKVKFGSTYNEVQVSLPRDARLVDAIFYVALTPPAPSDASAMASWEAASRDGCAQARKLAASSAAKSIAAHDDDPVVQLTLPAKEVTEEQIRMYLAFDGGTQDKLPGGVDMDVARKSVPVGAFMDWAFANEAFASDGTAARKSPFGPPVC